MNWVMRRSPLHRQTARHAAEKISAVPTIAQTKDGRYLLTMLMGARNEAQVAAFLRTHGIAGDAEGPAEDEAGQRAIPGSSAVGERSARLMDLVQRFVRKHSYDTLPWLEAQAAGIMCAPLRRPHENVADEHWQARGTFAEVEHPELGRSLTYAVRKWVSTADGWVTGRRAPLLGEDTEKIKIDLSERTVATATAPATAQPRAARAPAPSSALSALGKPMPLAGHPDPRLHLVPRLGRRHPVPHRPRRRVHQGGVEGQPRHADGGDGPGRRAGGPRGGDRPAARCHRPEHGRPVQQQERRASAASR